MRKTKKAFIGLLNKKHKNTLNWKNNRYHQLKRGYGDYLYYQDREQFNYYYKAWLEYGNSWESKL